LVAGGWDDIEKGRAMAEKDGKPSELVMPDDLEAKCDKCGLEVSLANDALALKNLYQGRGADADRSIGKAEHLMPVIKDEREVCEGSPSVLQYLDGQPRDARPDAPRYKPEREKRMREAYAELQLLAAAQGADTDNDVD
jgi:hypothetical protein